MVDAQAKIPLEAEHTVVPPGKTLFCLFKEPEAVFHSKCKQSLEGAALGLRAEDFSFPGRWIMHVAIVRGDIEVASQG